MAAASAAFRRASASANARSAAGGSGLRCGAGGVEGSSVISNSSAARLLSEIGTPGSHHNREIAGCDSYIWHIRLPNEFLFSKAYAETFPPPETFPIHARFKIRSTFRSPRSRGAAFDLTWRMEASARTRG